jgi:ribonuclease BN (tRNA processing enzyme)
VPEFRRGTLSVKTFPLNHPQGACGYRIESPDATVIIATDVEHGDPELDKVLRENSEGADLLIYDAQYTPTEYESRKGWGHSTYAAGASVARDAHVKGLVLFHHDPTHNDSLITQMIQEAIPLFENTIAARELAVMAF